MKVAILLILMVFVSSCTANVDSTLVGIFSSKVEKVENEAASENSGNESEQEDMIAEEGQVSGEVDETGFDGVFSDLRKLSESRSQIEEPQTNSSRRELIDLRDSHAERMSKKISNSGVETSAN